MRSGKIVAILIALLILTEARVFAYTDPGSGTLIWQILLAASFGVMFYLRRIIAWFRRLRAGRDHASPDDAPVAHMEKDSGPVEG